MKRTEYGPQRGKNEEKDERGGRGAELKKNRVGRETGDEGGVN